MDDTEFRTALMERLATEKTTAKRLLAESGIVSIAGFALAIASVCGCRATLAQYFGIVMVIYAAASVVGCLACFLMLTWGLFLFHERQQWAGEARLSAEELRAGDIKLWIAQYAPSFSKIQGGERWSGRGADLIYVGEREPYTGGDTVLRRTALMRTPAGAWFCLSAIIQHDQWRFDGFQALDKFGARSLLMDKPDVYARCFGEPPLAGTTDHAA